MIVEELADFPAIKQIGAALWRTGETRGAAVMVGAGFSLHAELPGQGSRKPPLWRDFSNEMTMRLYPSGGAPTDPLRLAEEYRAALGQASLEGLIFEFIRDAEWKPGALHHKLLDLPWGDVLTTNWDTLLERAAAVNVRQTYDVTRAVADIPRTRSPRVVKLHGSMPSNRPFIFAEEDYRTYPSVFAPFVNLAQQVLLENELCLVGFSGDDPNFLHWSGWVRDQLGAAARRIYLVGVLNASSARRKFFEARNVSVIDLAPLVTNSDDKHREALRLFLECLVGSKPRSSHDWPPSKSRHPVEAAQQPGGKMDAGVSARYLGDMLVAWNQERINYPGWLVCPTDKRHRIRFDTDLGRAFQAGYELLDPAIREKLLYELAWRYDVSFWPLPPWLREKLAEAVTVKKAASLATEERLYLALSLLRSAREDGDEVSFGRWSALIQGEQQPGSSIAAAETYERCLWLRDKLDYAKLQQLLSTLRGEDPAWKIRRSGLHWELGEFAAAKTTIEDALRDLRDRHARDRKSIWILSRLAWASFLARVTDFSTPSASDADDPFVGLEWPSIFREVKSDPWDELHTLDTNLERSFREKAKDAITKRAGFDAGTYIDKSGGTRFVSSAVVSPTYDIFRLTEAAGLPVRTKHFDVMGGRLRRSCELVDSDDERELFKVIRVVSSHSDDLIEKRFARIQVARIGLQTVEKLINLLWQTIDFGAQHFADEGDTHWIERVRLHTEVLSRLVVRLPPSKAVESFRRAAAYAKDSRWSHWWLYDSLGHLLERSLSAIPPADRTGLLVEVLNLPVADERGAGGMGGRWPEVVESLDPALIVRPADTVAFNHRVGELIQKVRTSQGDSRGNAALRMTVLHEAGVLDGFQRKAFGEALWSRRPSESDFPEGTNLLPHVFLAVPGPEPEKAEHIFRERIINRFKTGDVSEFLLNGLYGAGMQRKGHSAFTFSADEALAILDVILAWKPKAVEFDIGFTGRENLLIGRLTGPVLADVILPVLDPKLVGTPRVDGLLELAAREATRSVISALPQVVRLDASRSSEVVKLIHTGLLSSDPDTTYAAFGALGRWSKRSLEPKLPLLPEELRQAAVSVAATRREPGLLHALEAVIYFVEKGELSKSEESRLADTLEILRTETEYDNWSGSNEQSITLTLVRASCVRLAHKLKMRGSVHTAVLRWLSNAKDDAIPEARFALATQ